MCCSDDECDVDIFMFVLRCFVEKTNLLFVGRVFVGMCFDGFEGSSIEFNELDDNDDNIILVVVTAVLYVTLFIRILVKYKRGEDVYKFHYVILFKLISLFAAFVIFNTTSSFDWNTIKQLYIHFTDWEIKEMLLTAINLISFLDIILNFFSIFFLLCKIYRAKKDEKGTFRERCTKSLYLASKSDAGECEGQNQQSVFSVNVEYPNAAS